MERSGETDFQDQVRGARKKFVAMAATYTLGVFNDNFFKQAISLIALAEGFKGRQGTIAFIFTLPFVLFAAPAGWMADRFPKGGVVIFSKALELGAMLAGAAGIITDSWPLMFLMLALMGIQATIFGPSLNGSIPELYPAGYVMKANSLLKAVTTAAIIAGMAAAGFALDRKGAGPFGAPMGHFVVAVGVVSIALLGLAASLGVPRRPAASPGVAFPWSGPVKTIKTLRSIGKDLLLSITLAAASFFWFVGLLQVLLLNALGRNQFQMSDTATSLLTVAELVGISIGGLAAGRIAYNRRWYRILAPSAFALGVFMLMMVFVPCLPRGAAIWTLYVLLAAMGIAGGFFLVPVESFLQVRPDAQRKGEVLSAANFATFAAMLLSGPVYSLLVVSLSLRPTTGFAVTGVFTMLMSMWLFVIWNSSRSRRWPAVARLMRSFDRASTEDKE